ncbi:MAG TPA: MBL fold metallo-hydrolase [Stellaceae bacterium]|nr:MBL fold metallo-hydrolase [Stellaceae bacterium]
MLIRFWGTRGSLPAPLSRAGVRQKLREALAAAKGRSFDGPAAIERFLDDELPFATSGTYGGNSSCVEIEGAGDEYVLCDLGSGAREFGVRVLQEKGAQRKAHINVFLSHLHWDHIMGFPFLPQAYIPGNVIRLHGCHSVIHEAFQRQQSDPCFPVDLRQLGATLEYVQLEPDRSYDIAGLTVRATLQNHAGDSYGYRFARDGKTMVYSTDCEHKFQVLDESYKFVGFFRDADLLIFDSMYSLAESISVKEDWGHSSNMVAVELAQLAGVKHLVLYHHEPMFDDRTIETILGETRRYEELSRSGAPVKITSAYDGLEIVL